MKVSCEVEQVDIERDDGRKQAGVRVTCGRCGHTTQSFGTTDKSTMRCLMLLKEECPNDERNFYEADE